MTDEHLEKHRKEILDACGSAIRVLDEREANEARERARVLASRLEWFEGDVGTLKKIEYAGFVRGVWSEKSQGQAEIDPVWDVTVGAAVVGCMAEYSLELMADMIGMEMKEAGDNDSSEIVLRG